MINEPRAKNKNKCPPNVWRALTEEERAFYNAVYAQVLYFKEKYQRETWEDTSRLLSIAATEVFRRSNIHKEKLKKMEYNNAPVR